MFLQDEQLMLTKQEDELRQGELSGDLQWQNVLDLSDGEDCAYCRSRHAEGPLPQRCPLCLLSWHDHCAKEFAQVHRDSILKLYPAEESSGSRSTLTEAQEP